MVRVRAPVALPAMVCPLYDAHVETSMSQLSVLYTQCQHIIYHLSNHIIQSGPYAKQHLANQRLRLTWQDSSCKCLILYVGDAVGRREAMLRYWFIWMARRTGRFPQLAGGPPSPFGLRRDISP